MKKFLILLICIFTLITSLTSCSKPPEYSEIEADFKALIEASYRVNDILFGEGLPTYERVYEREFEVYQDSVTKKVYYYYELEDEELGSLIGYRHTEISYFAAFDSKKGSEEPVFENGGKFYYEIEYNGTDEKKEVDSFEDTESGETYYFYVIEDSTYGKVYEYRQQMMKYLVKSETERSGETAVYKNTSEGYFLYPVEYSEKVYDFYYSGEEPTGYRYVRVDAEYVSIEQIKEYAESVYSDEYLKGIYEMLFTGAVIAENGGGSLGARYYNYEDSDGRVWLMQSEEHTSLLSGKRIYDFDTAKVVRPGSKDFVNIEIESYLEGEPDKRMTVKLSMARNEDGEWRLDSATY